MTSTTPTLCVIATSHLDTQWRWTFRDTINRYLPRTLKENFALFEKFPHYRFSFEGAFRYMLIKEYFPEEYDLLKHYVAEGRWNVIGASIDAGDVNTVSPESLVRQALYGNGFFKREFGKVSRDIFLPDCFGFGWTLPSIAAHCGLKGFSTSKLEWGSSRGIPFSIGFWEGVDGNGVVAQINPGQYSFGIKEDVSRDEKWASRIDENGRTFGAPVEFKYFGLGDTGGAPDEASVEWLEKAIAGDGPLRVVSAAADELCQQFTPEQIARMPRHRDEFLLIEHGVGTYTSNGAMKLLNRRNELLADAAERAATLAHVHGVAPYPAEVLAEAWTRVLANQMHDILPGTSIPEAYHLSWNDEFVSLNQFEGALRDSVAAIAAGMDTRPAKGWLPVLVFSGLDHARAGIVTLLQYDLVGFPRVYTATGEELPCQVHEVEPGLFKVDFQAPAISPGLSVYGLDCAETPSGVRSGHHISAGRLENEHLLVELNGDGDISRIYDKANRREVLSAPISLQLFDHGPKEWPAWTILHPDISAAPRSLVSGPAEIVIEEEGPVRATLRVTRTHEGSRYDQRISLTAGSPQVEVETKIAWETRGTLLKAAFPLAVANPKATYDLGLGNIERGNNHPRLYEVPAQQWVDLSAPDGAYGVSILSDCKYGWDKPDDNTLRLTLLHTPRMMGFECHLGGANYVDHFLEQAELDFGHHVMRFAIRPHVGDWRSAGVVQAAAAFNQPPIAFSVEPHAGPLGGTAPGCSLSTKAVALMAMKKAEESDEIIVRLRELYGHQQDAVRLSMPAAIVAAREVNGMEEPLGPATVDKGELVVDLRPFAPRTFALTLAHSALPIQPAVCVPVDLPFNLDGISPDSDRCDGDFDGQGRSIPSELLPDVVLAGHIAFRTGPRGYREKNVLLPAGQSIALPPGDFDALYLLAAGVGGNAALGVRIDGFGFPYVLQDWSGRIGSWDDRVLAGTYHSGGVDGLVPAFVKPARLAWVGTHRHSRSSSADEAYEYCYLYSVRIPLRKGAKEVVFLPENRARILAATLVRDDQTVGLLSPKGQLHCPSFR